MAIYGIKSNAVDFTGVEEFAYEVGMEGALAIVAESEQNYNKIMKAIGVSELNYFEATGEEMVYEAGKIEGFFTKVKEFFRKLLQKLKALYAKFIAWLDSYVKQGDEFAKKYGPVLRGKTLDGFEYEGFKFTHLDGVDKLLFTAEKKEMKKAETLFNDAANHIETYTLNPEGDAAKTMKGYEEYAADDYEDKLRGEVLGQNEVSASEFSSELYEFFRGGESKGTERLGKSDVLESLKHIETAKKDIEKAKTTLKTSQTAIEKVVASIERAEAKMLKAEKTSTGGSKAISAANKCVAAFKSMMNINVIVNGAYVAALKDRNRQARSMCVKAVSYRTDSQKEKEKLFGEGFTHFTEGFLENVVLN